MLNESQHAGTTEHGYLRAGFSGHDEATALEYASQRLMREFRAWLESRFPALASLRVRGLADDPETPALFLRGTSGEQVFLSADIDRTAWDVAHNHRDLGGRFRSVTGVPYQPGDHAELVAMGRHIISCAGHDTELRLDEPA